MSKYSSIRIDEPNYFLMNTYESWCFNFELNHKSFYKNQEVTNHQLAANN